MILRAIKKYWVGYLAAIVLFLGSAKDIYTYSEYDYVTIKIFGTFYKGYGTQGIVLITAELTIGIVIFIVTANLTIRFIKERRRQ